MTAMATTMPAAMIKMVVAMSMVLRIMMVTLVMALMLLCFFGMPLRCEIQLLVVETKAIASIRHHVYGFA